MNGRDHTEHPLWLFVHFPALALEALERGLGLELERGEPVAVLEHRGHRSSIVAVNEAAAHQGIAPGMNLGTALALSGELRCVDRCIEAEHDTVRLLAGWALLFSPNIYLADGGIGIEIGR